MMTLTTLKGTPLALLTEAWNRCWEGYPYALNFTEENLRIWMELGQVQLNHSLALKDQCNIVGFSLLSQMNGDGWIAGAAIDPRYRRRNLFTPMLQTHLNLARSLGLKRLILEVLTQNEARYTYQNLGFYNVRTLHCYRIAPEILHFDPAHRQGQRFRRVELSRYFLARRIAHFVPPWQRRAPHLKRFPETNAWLNTQETAGMLYSGNMLLDAWAAFADSAEELLSVLRRQCAGEFSLANQPLDPVTNILTDAGIQPKASLLEMVCNLEASQPNIPE